MTAQTPAEQAAEVSPASALRRYAELMMRTNPSREVREALYGALAEADATDPAAVDAAREQGRREGEVAGLRAAADYLDDKDEAIATALRGVDHPIGVLRDRADFIEAEEGDQ